MTFLVFIVISSICRCLPSVLWVDLENYAAADRTVRRCPPTEEGCSVEAAVVANHHAGGWSPSICGCERVENFFLPIAFRVRRRRELKDGATTWVLWTTTAIAAVASCAIQGAVLADREAGVREQPIRSALETVNHFLRPGTATKSKW